MSLYYEAASVLANSENAGGSLKARLYRQKNLKSSPAQLFALISEASKWSLVLKDVVEKCGLLREEKKLSPILALLLCHDLIVSKSGVVAPANHVLKLAITRHKARLGAEFTKARIRLGYPTLESFREAVNNGALDEEQQSSQIQAKHPRWVRVNTLKVSLEELLTTTFAEYEEAETLTQVMTASGSTKIYFPDSNIPNLLAFPPKIDISKFLVYTNGNVILQDKASCFPAYLLNVAFEDGDAIDGCAAPGNKTTHLAAIMSNLSPGNRSRKIIAFERDKTRAGILQKMVKLAAADKIASVKANADFLAANPDAEEYSNVSAILLDPSCSGSGIVGREDSVQMHLPDPSPQSIAKTGSSLNKKRKRNDISNTTAKGATTVNLALDDSTHEETPLEDKTSERLAALSAFQYRILTHAMRFQNARKITYSTCSIHFEENEGVVARALSSSIAQSRGWRVLTRAEQVEGLKKWERRGFWENEKLEGQVELSNEQTQTLCDACIRCEKGTEEGTMGFFVAALVRDPSLEVGSRTPVEQNAANSDEEWNGFSDADGAESITEVVVPVTSSQPKKKRKKGRK
ncbi:NOL1/NOP2/Sun domain family [Periconia macrospinosa]|uniref:NOL1/NOP2/Sun domain family n=1 Tax=Periconia macrospinosa TaxID=97972 RepID=A0A2V1DR81_9PLEO|nr:NOL1/NOP2/Sun domain family [Periconia macrospinosa]